MSERAIAIKTAFVGVLKPIPCIKSSERELLKVGGFKRGLLPLLRKIFFSTPYPFDPPPWKLSKTSNEVPRYCLICRTKPRHL